MRRVFLPVLVCTLSLMFTGSALAANITYNVRDVIGNGLVTGTITTDGATGTLFNGDIVGFDLTLRVGNTTATLMNGVNGGSVFLSGGSFSATPTQLLFNFGLSGTFVNFTSTGCAPFWSLRTAGGSVCGVASGIISAVGTSSTNVATMSRTGIVPIGNVIPEPGTLGMLGTGLIGLAGLTRRKLKPLGK